MATSDQTIHQTSDQSRDGRPVRLVLTIGGALLLVTALAVIVAGQWWLHQRRDDDAQKEAARRAAEHAVSTVLSYDYRRIQEGIHRSRDLLTGSARKQFVDLARPLKTTAPQLQAQVTARVTSTAVLSMHPESARVLLFVDQRSISKDLTRPRVDQSRIAVTLVSRDGRWLVANLSAV
jgi:Mce-associated membrane protein